MSRFYFMIVAAAAIVPLAGGCGGPPPPPAAVTIPGYEALREQFTGIDMSPLRGRRVVLDPGHGGYFQGAVGVNGLTEAEVNLGVALYLRGLLEWAGSQVFMTRTADYDFLSPADSTLATDLAFRTSFVDSLQPDVFLSLHHNSVASLDRTVNETQTYYPLNDDGASLDLARAIHRHLVLNLEITPAKILPGNFYVLRNVTVPAVLGEPAMISHPVIAGRLSLAASQRLEAEAYFLGLLDFFSQGSPRWAGAAVDTLLVEEGRDGVHAVWLYLADALAPDGAASPGPDPGTFRLTLDGKAVPFHVTAQGRSVHWLPSSGDIPLPAVLELRGRNLAGRALPVRRTVLMPGAVRQIRVTLMPETLTEKEGYWGLHWRVPAGFPLPEGSLRVFTNAGSGDDLTFPVKGGSTGAALVRVPAGPITRVEFSAAAADTPALPCDLAETPLPAPWSWRLLEDTAGNGVIPWSLRTLPAAGLPPGMADQHLPLVPYRAGDRIWVTAPGWLPLVDPDPANPDTARTVAAADRIWRTRPLAPALHGKVIVLDPVGGGSVTDGTGPLGTRGSSVNLETARLAADLLEGCGATVYLTRRGETAPGAPEKVRRAGDLGTDLFLSIGRAEEPGLWQASHHPGSATGRQWGELFLNCASGLAAAPDSLALTPSYDYLLRHTACPALEIRFPGPTTAAREMLLLERGWLRVEARAILHSILSLWFTEADALPTLDLAALITALPGALDLEQVAWAELDGNLDWSPVPARGTDGGLSLTSAGALDSFRDPGLPALGTQHTLEIQAGPHQQLWLLEKTASGFEGRLMFDTR